MKREHEHRKENSSSELKVNASKEWDLIQEWGWGAEIDQETNVFSFSTLQHHLAFKIMYIDCFDKYKS